MAPAHESRGQALDSASKWGSPEHLPAARCEKQHLLPSRSPRVDAANALQPVRICEVQSCVEAVPCAGSGRRPSETRSHCSHQVQEPTTPKSIISKVVNAPWPNLRSEPYQAKKVGVIARPVDRASRVRMPEAPLVGIWVDPLSRFFGGCRVAICSDAWQPVSPILELHRASTYQFAEDGPTHYVLHQTSPNGNRRRFDVTPGEAEDTLLVNMADANLTWTLARVPCDAVDDGAHAQRRMTDAELFIREYREAAVSRLDSTDEPPTWLQRLHAAVCMVAASALFEIVMGVVILVNAVLLGIDSELDMRNASPPWLDSLEHVFLVIYIIEISIKLLDRGIQECMQKGWFIFDLVLVALGVSYTWVVKPITVHAIGASESDGEIFQRVIALRLLRLLRMIRALRMLPFLKASWRMVSGLLDSWSTMLSMLLLLVLVLYLFACFGLEIITKDDAVQQTLQEHDLVGHFDSLFMIMLTLTQFVTLDSCASIYFPIIRKHPALAFYFFPVVVIVSISLMNLVTAVLVEGNVAMASNDRRELRLQLFHKIKHLDPEFREFFRRVDANGSGAIQLVEMEHLASASIPEELMDKITPELLLELLEILDADGSGDISEAEFVDGLLNLCLAESDVISNDTLMLMRQVKVTRNKSVKIERTVQQVESELCALREAFTRMEREAHSAYTDTCLIRRI
eukprot:NODE_1469_length_2465_cov_10.558597.p1 GENE.NODE_1469_length_2465_cov_10.558597~~NODE_1469_length_2465_cov_10.558597.p1  ORF type:complete len:698 (+),score=183.72 NODE_1469_length_2465_cov_10.558597:39-2096(+)